MLHYMAVVTIGLFITPCAGVNYCQSKMCAFTNAHTFCQFAGGRSRDCIGYISAPLSEDEQTQIIDRMNQRRNEVASGKLRAWPSATNMMKLRWVPELAREAQLWADQCRRPKTPEEHDACRDLYSVSVGQCVASVVGDAPGLKVASVVDVWFMQGLYYKANVSNYVPPPSTKHYYGDFAQLMWSNSYMVGCGRSRFMQEILGRVLSVERVVCNIAPSGPALGRALWAVGPHTACPDMALPDDEFKALCNYQYQNDTKIKINNSTSLEEHILLNTILEMERNKDATTSLDEKYSENLAIAMFKEKNKAILLEKRKRNVWKVDKRISDFNEIERLKDKILNRKTTVTKSKKLNLVGRPKSYKFEELSGIDGDHRKNNVEISEEHKRKALFDIDEEYNNIDNDDIDRNDITKEIESENTSTTPALKNINYLIKEVPTERTRVNFNLKFGNRNKDLKLRDKPIQKLNEPETVNELQAALEHLEKEGETKGRFIHGKVRRDLRDLVTEAMLSDEDEKDTERDIAERDIDSNSLQQKDTSPSKPITLAEEKPNISDKNPMMDMVMKYMPYLKNYENNLLGKDDSEVNSAFKFVSGVETFICLVLLSIL